MIDLHVHSTASDGTIAPGDIGALAVQAGLTVVALTDHDTTAGIAEVAATLPGEVLLVPGVEISCTVPVGDRRQTVHLLGYFVDPHSRALDTMLHTTREGPRQRAQLIVRLLALDGHNITWADVLARAGENRPDIVHIADALIAAGVVASRTEAFSEAWIGTRGRYGRPTALPTVFDAMTVVRGAGGVPVLAHPRQPRGVNLTVDDLAELTAYGLEGLEVFHPDHDTAARDQLRGLAADLGLVVTGGSEFHGTRRPHQLAAETTTREAYEQLLARSRSAAPILGAP